MSGGAARRAMSEGATPLTVALYLRVSRGEATRGQRETLLAWARREGWRVVVRYEDRGSGMDGAGRPGLRGLLVDAASGAFERVLVTRRDRFARNSADAARWEELLARHGVQLWSHDEPLANEESPAGLLMRRLLDLLAEHYARDAAERVRGRARARLAAGLPLGPVPFGYRRAGAGRPWARVPREAAAVRAAFRLYASGKHSDMEVAAMLTTRDVAPRSRRGHRRFGKAAVATILTNPVYAGDLTLHGRVIGRGRQPPLVARALFDRVQRARARRATGSRGDPRRPAALYLLAGVGRHAGCGAQPRGNTHAEGGTPQRAYRCAARELGAPGRASGARARRCRRGAHAEAVEARLAEALAACPLPAPWLARARALAREAGRPAPRAPLLGAAWLRMSPTERRQLVRLLLVRVDVDLERAEPVRLVPRPPFAPLFEGPLRGASSRRHGAEAVLRREGGEAEPRARRLPGDAPRGRRRGPRAAPAPARAR